MALERRADDALEAAGQAQPWRQVDLEDRAAPPN